MRLRKNPQNTMYFHPWKHLMNPMSERQVFLYVEDIETDVLLMRKAILKTGLPIELTDDYHLKFNSPMKEFDIVSP